jgi:hypothetical protein
MSFSLCQHLPTENPSQEECSKCMPADVGAGGWGIVGDMVNHGKARKGCDHSLWPG